MKVFVGISINSLYFSKENLLNYVQYLDGINNFEISELAFLIGDIPYSLTYSVLNSISISKSFRIVNNKGNDFVNVISNRIKTRNDLSFKIKIIKWEELTKNSFYDNLYKKVKIAYDTNSKFAKNIRQQVNINLRESLKNKNITEFDYRLLDHYVLDEISGLLTMSEYLNYEYEIYPGIDLFILDYIISGKLIILDNYIRKFKQIKFE